MFLFIPGSPSPLLPSSVHRLSRNCFSVLTAPALCIARHTVVLSAWPGRWGFAGFSPHSSACPCCNRFQVDVRGGARHAAQRLEVAANQHVVVGKVFFQLHVYLHFRKLQGVVGVFAADGTDSRHRLFQPDVGTEADALQPGVSGACSGCCGSLSVWLPGWGQSPALRCAPRGRRAVLRRNLRQAVYRVHHVAHRERAAGMHAL